MNNNRKHFCGLSNRQPYPIGIGKCGLEMSWVFVSIGSHLWIVQMQAHVMWLSRKMADTPNSPNMTSKCSIYETRCSQPWDLGISPSPRNLHDSIWRQPLSRGEPGETRNRGAVGSRLRFLVRMSWVATKNPGKFQVFQTSIELPVL